ncbi:MAG: restriction endonuclease subunit S [Lachnospiraceae bacterium]|nr:restriction endonuclease subunit S [Lachnospiraceae bacterium]
MGNVKNVPKLRFPGFTDAWEQRKVQDIYKITRGYVLAAPETAETSSEEMPYPVYSSQTKNNGLMGYYKDYLYENAITWTTDGANAGTVCYRAGKFYCTNVCGVLLSDDGHSNKCAAEALNSVAWKWVSHVGNPKLMNNVMGEIPITLPKSVEEQDRISDFFEQIDTLIALHQRKCDEAKNLKKCMLQKMFPKDGEQFPEIRFPGFTDAWEQRKLGDMASFSKGSGYSKGDLKDDGTPIILYGRLYTKYETVISEVDTFVDEKKGSVLSKGGEVIVPASGETAEDISIASVVEKSGVLLGGDLNIITPPDDMDSAFLAISISNGKPHNDMAKMAQGKSVVHLHNSDLEKIDLPYPSYDEQRRISEFFSDLDKLITLHQRKCDEIIVLKKALLQQMFV